ncbi:MAG: DNA replication/repair protein RecF [Wenzhouxiangellaceae bacterium]
MRIDSLAIENLRNLEQVEIVPGARVNWFFGDNGAGKTSVLEAIHVLARGRSFRTASIGALIRDGAEQVRVFARTRDPGHRLGVERGRTRWRGRVDGQDCTRVSEFAQRLPLVLVAPDNHQLLESSPALRRSFLDWLVFHVEPSHLQACRDYQRALRQRNAALRSETDDPLLEAHEHTLAQHAVLVDLNRAKMAAELDRVLAGLQGTLDFGVPTIEAAYREPARDAEHYRERWAQMRVRDRLQGHTQDGPHRADLVVTTDRGRAAARLSRGQMKLAALMLQLAALEILTERGRAPLLLLDDPVSELDQRHLGALLDWLGQRDQQSLITAVEAPQALDATLFHVEQGRITPVL